MDNFSDRVEGGFRGYKNKLLKAKLKQRLRQRQTELETD